MKKIAVVAIKKIALDAYLAQVKNFFGEEALVMGYALEENPMIIQGDIILTTSHFILNTVRRRLADKEAEILHISGTFSRKQIQQLSRIPAHAKVLVVNSSKELIYDCLAQLRRILRTPIEYVAYSEEEDVEIDPGDFEYAVTFIEPFRRREKVRNLIELEGRWIHPYIYEHILDTCFRQNEVLEGKLVEYRSRMVPINLSAVDSMNMMTEWEEILYQVIQVTDKGVVILDDNNAVKGCNEPACELLQIHKGQVYNAGVEDIPGIFETFETLDKIGENTELKFYCRAMEQWVKASKRIIQYYSYRFLTLLFIEGVSDEAPGGRKEAKARFCFTDIICKSEGMMRIVEVAKQISYSGSAVLLTGETGTGKELFAHAIHNHSQRRDMPFLAVNCAAFPENLLESELFGYEPGTFTGALKNGKKGIFEIATGGTVFLDEIGDAPLSIQAKLLRILQEKEIRRIGGEVNIPVDVRILSATNKDLKRRISEELFRKDLYYRLNTFSINIPPLRERREDIEPLAVHFLRQNHYGYKKISPTVLRRLESQDWDGNLRELKNCIDYMAFMSGDEITEKDLPEQCRGVGRKEKMEDCMGDEESGGKQYREAVGSPYGHLNLQDREFAFFLLSELYYHSAGRDRLLVTARNKGIALTEHHMKRMLKWLSDENLIVQKKGRGGAVLTEEGMRLFRDKNPQ